jgi:hypothetical protein
MTFDKYTKQVKEILGIKCLTSLEASALMNLYLKRTSAEAAAKQLEEK